MSFLKKLTQTLLSPFLSPAKPKPKKKKAPAVKRAAKLRPANPVKKAAAAKKPAKKTAVKAQKTALKARNTKKAAPAKAKPSKALKSKGKAKLRKTGGGAIKPGAKVEKPIPGTLVAHVTHFFPAVNAAAMKIESGTLEVGNEIYFKGATTDFKMKILSMQINRVPVTTAGKGAEIGILSKKRVREGDAVYKLS